MERSLKFSSQGYNTPQVIHSHALPGRGDCPQAEREKEDEVGMAPDERVLSFHSSSERLGPNMDGLLAGLFELARSKGCGSPVPSPQLHERPSLSSRVPFAFVCSQGSSGRDTFYCAKVEARGMD